MKNIAILCSGGDVSGMNAALKRFVEYSIAKGLTPFFIEHGYEGLIDNKIYEAGYGDVAGIISRGGTKIGTSRSKRFMQDGYREKALENLKAHHIGYVIVLGGDGSFKGMQKLSDESGDIQFCGIPSTIDNDIAGTEYCLGVDTALNVIKFSIDAIRDTASSFGRAFIIETM
jgi:6-phosphofructokinase 1